MANEWTIQSTATVSNGNLKYSHRPAAFRLTQTTKNGPTPGAVSATTSGVTVSLAQLTTPGIVILTNTDATNYVSIGLYTGGTTYRPFAEIAAGESYVFKLARDILTANTADSVLRLKADTATCIVMVQAFDK